MPAPRRSPRDDRRRRLSQNFLHPDLAEQLVESAELSPGELVLEVGAGNGAITAALARRDVEVIALELDAVWAQKLARRIRSAGTARIRVVQADVLHFTLPTQSFRMVGSLPFGATTSILRRFLDDPRIPLKRADIIVQWEVARKRAATPPGTLLSTVWAPWWDFRLASHIRATSFRPVPRADGGHLVVTRRDPPLLPLDIAGAYGEFVRSWWALRR